MTATNEGASTHVTAQSEIKQAMATGVADGKLKGTKTIKARAVLELEGFATLERMARSI